MPSCYLGGSAFGILLDPRVVSFSCSSSLLRRRCIRPAHFASKLAISEPNSVDCLLCSWFLSYFVFLDLLDSSQGYPELGVLGRSTRFPQPVFRIQSDRHGGWRLQLTCLKSLPPTRIREEQPQFSPKFAVSSSTTRVAGHCFRVKFRSCC